MNLTQIILGILLPPLGVYLSVGLGSAFIIILLLTFLGWIPGVIHALWVMTKESEKANA